MDKGEHAAAAWGVKEVLIKDIRPVMLAEDANEIIVNYKLHQGTGGADPRQSHVVAARARDGTSSRRRCGQ